MLLQVEWPYSESGQESLSGCDWLPSCRGHTSHCGVVLWSFPAWQDCNHYQSRCSVLHEEAACGYSYDSATNRHTLGCDRPWNSWWKTVVSSCIRSDGTSLWMVCSRNLLAWFWRDWENDYNDFETVECDFCDTCFWLFSTVFQIWLVILMTACQ